MFNLISRLFSTPARTAASAAADGAKKAGGSSAGGLLPGPLGAAIGAATDLATQHEREQMRRGGYSDVDHYRRDLTTKMGPRKEPPSPRPSRSRGK
jgi:hypothetical protein